MKITCQSCQSKYTVSDEKVQGKTVKIKCRKCGATILVNSSGATTSTGADSASTGGAEGGVSYLVNVADGDQRSMSLQEIVAAYRGSVITSETYVWADGMGDWQPLANVDAITAALNEPAASEPAPAPAPEPVAAAAPEPEPRAAARRDPGRGARDLFGGGMQAEEVRSSAQPMFNGSGAGLAASTPRAAPGAREENSMLFSLSALTAKAASPASAPKASTAKDREDSGIIDLKALAASASVPTASAPLQASFVPDGGLFPLGVPAVAAPVAAPTAAEAAPAKSKAGIFIGVGAVVAVGAIVGAFFVMKGGGDKPVPATTASAAETASAAPPPSATVAASASASASAVAAVNPAAAAPSASAVAGKAGGKSYPKGGGGKAAPKGGAPAAAPAAAAPAAPKKSSCGCAPGDLMCAMRCSAGGK